MSWSLSCWYWGGSGICRWGSEGFSLGLWLQDGVVVTLGLLQENLGCHQQEQLWFWLMGGGFGCSDACPGWRQGLSGDSAAIPSGSEESAFPQDKQKDSRNFSHEISASPDLWALQGCAFPCARPVLPWEVCPWVPVPGDIVHRSPLVATGPPRLGTAGTAALDGHKNLFPVSRAHRKVGAFILFFHGCPCETGMLHPGKFAFPLDSCCSLNTPVPKPDSST